MGIFQPALLLNHFSEGMSECGLSFWSVFTWSVAACRLHLSNQPTWNSQTSSLWKWTWSFVTFFARWGIQQALKPLGSWPRQCAVVTVKQTSANSSFLVLVGRVCSARVKGTVWSHGDFAGRDKADLRNPAVDFCLICLLQHSDVLLIFLLGLKQETFLCNCCLGRLGSSG